MQGQENFRSLSGINPQHQGQDYEHSKAKHQRFCFTYALPGGAWIEDERGERNWFSFDMLNSWYGESTVRAWVKRHGWMTGCWVDCWPVEIGRGVMLFEDGSIRCNV